MSEQAQNLAPTTTELDPRDLDRVVAIFYYGRSGSIFLQSLLDSHPEVLTFPSIYLSGFYSFWQQFGHLPALELVAAFLQNYDVLFDAGSPHNVPDCGPAVGIAYNFDKMGPERAESLGIERDRFVDILLGKLALVIDDFKREVVTRKFFFQALHAAYSEALGRELRTARPIIVFQLHNPFAVAVLPLAEDFPHMRFLHTIREPTQAMGSWYLHMVASYGRWEGLPGSALGRGMEHSKPITRTADYRVRAVRLEDLHGRPKETLERACAWLGIGWDENVLRSTFDGRLWHWAYGNKVVTGFHSHSISRSYDHVFWPLDRLRIRFLLAARFAAWSYPIAPVYRITALAVLATLLWVFPFRMELSMWQRQRPFTRRKLLTLARDYIGLRRSVLGSWFGELTTKPALFDVL